MRGIYRYRILVVITALGLGIALLGCATTGSKRIINDNILAQIKRAESTRADVKALIGEPFKVTFTDNDEEVWDYQYVRTKPKTSSFLPVLGPWVGGSSSQIHTLTIRFTSEGIVKEIGRGKTTSRGGSVFD